MVGDGERTTGFVGAGGGWLRVIKNRLDEFILLKHLIFSRLDAKPQGLSP